MLLEVVASITVRLPTGKETWTAGRIVSLPRDKAQRLLEQAPQHVKVLSLVYWESGRGEIHGPGKVEHLISAPDSQGNERAWSCVQFQGSWRWLREDRLRPAPGRGKQA